MLVEFESTETAEILMFAETARELLQIVGKETTARGVFTQPEMEAAAAALRDAIRCAPPASDDEADEDDPEVKRKPPVVRLSQRAWPLLDMLERTARAGREASIVWTAPADF